jgi:hypothetical protein
MVICSLATIQTRYTPNAIRCSIMLLNYLAISYCPYTIELQQKHTQKTHDSVCLYHFITVDATWLYRLKLTQMKIQCSKEGPTASVRQHYDNKMCYVSKTVISIYHLTDIHVSFQHYLLHNKTQHEADKALC